MRTLTLCLALAAAAHLSACAHLPADEPADPLEPVNRGIFKFNRSADRYVLRPVAKKYKRYVPGEVRVGIYNFIDNLFYPTVIVNDILQAKFAQGGKDLGRFVINSTVGLAGILDVATPLGLQRNREDFGQTLGYWGVGEGWYLMIPLLGPSTNRDLVGRGADYFTRPTAYADTYPSLAVTGTDAIDSRSRLLGADRLLNEQLDPYVFIRTVYLENRYNLVFDGNPPKEKFVFDE